MGRKGEKFQTRSGEQGVVLHDDGTHLFVKFFGGGKGKISHADVSKFYPNMGRGRSRRQEIPQTAPRTSDKPCRNCGNVEPHYVGGGHRCSMCDTEYMEGFKGWLLTEMPMQSGRGLAAVQEGGLVVIFKPTMRLKRAVASQNADLLWNRAHVDVVGILEIRDNSLYQSLEVERIWAQKGYGPLLYMIGMSTDPERGMMPTRVQQHISDPAKNVWQQFSQGKGQHLVTPQDAVNDEGSPASHHPEPYLNQKYVINKPHPEFGNMIARGQQFFQDDKYGEKKTNFIEFADGYLKHQMDQIYDFD